MSLVDMLMERVCAIYCVTYWTAIRFTADAQHLLIRLCLRKEDKWHRLSDLKYEKQLGSLDNIRKAIDELCSPAPFDETKNLAQVTEVMEPTLIVDQEGREIIDLTSDEDDKPEEVDFSPRPAEIFAFAEDDSAMTTKDLLGCLTLDELKDFGKRFKIKVKGSPNVSLLCS